MAENKKSFVLYSDLIHTVNKLTNEKAGELFKHILSYVNDENPKPNDMLIEIAFEPIKQQLKRDLKHWEEIKIKKSEGGKKAMEKRWTEKQIENQSEPQHDIFPSLKPSLQSYFDSLINGDEINKTSIKLKIPIDFTKNYIESFKRKVDNDGYTSYGKFLNHFQNSLVIEFKNNTTKAIITPQVKLGTR